MYIPFTSEFYLKNEINKMVLKMFECDKMELVRNAIVRLPTGAELFRAVSHRLQYSFRHKQNNSSRLEITRFDFEFQYPL